MSECFALGLIGYPLGHSISPVLHHAALDAAGLQGEYQLFEAPPLPEGKKVLAKLFEDLRSRQLHGLNVTIPHKQNIFPYLDDTTRAARHIGAVNVVFCQDGRLIGDNTDAAGFLADLERFLKAQSRQSGSALVLGAGGSARAVVYALHTDGWQVTVAARRIQQARALAEQIGPGQIQSIHLEPGGIAVDWRD
jgi:shikimate dehydrogenase